MSDTIGEFDLDRDMFRGDRSEDMSTPYLPRKDKKEIKKYKIRMIEVIAKLKGIEFNEEFIRSYKGISYGTVHNELDGLAVKEGKKFKDFLEPKYYNDFIIK